ncbi:hypothetical protein EIP91_007928 [Steccherinum ochraceum]|uniref:HMG domain-containing protein n=1 Tax=Steccherinum ochraceum TaxID=92696 RepID=A0A4R0RQD0_9APHY|nr:hypothetical protein EIP91_007928 [Steccherinum ochraceum]
MSDDAPRSRLVVSSTPSHIIIPSDSSLTHRRSKLVVNIPDEQPVAAKKRSSSSQLLLYDSAGPRKMHKRTTSRAASGATQREPRARAPTAAQEDEDVIAPTVSEAAVAGTSTAQSQLHEPVSADDPMMGLVELGRHDSGSSTLEERYWAALVDERDCACFRLDDDLFVLQDWSEEEQLLALGVYHHLTALPFDEALYGCTLLIPSEELEPDADGCALLNVASRDDGLGPRGCISFLPIPAPRWCSLPTEWSFVAPKPTYTNPYFPLTDTSRCSCGAGLGPDVLFAKVPVIRSATLYDKDFPKPVTIEVIQCISCRHARRQIGPDLSEFGLFNWNNSLIFSHDILNAYTSMFTASETPFTAYCLTMRRSYAEHGFEHQFCSDDTFIRVWFAFIRLQELDSSMSCPTCGPSPSIIIADGVSLAPHISKLTSKIRPPTTTTSLSERCESISTYKARKLPLIPEPAMRKVLKGFLEAVGSQTDSEDAWKQRIEPLKVDYPAVSQFALLYIQAAVADPKSETSRALRMLLDQISAPDIALQLVPLKAVPLLRDMASASTDPAAWLQRLIPAMGHVLRCYRIPAQGETARNLPVEVRTLAGWLADRAETVYNQLARHDPADAAPISADTVADSSWRQTGTYYGLPEIRQRRVYAKLRNDGQSADRGVEDKSDYGIGGCKKYYSTYSKSNLAGGIMVLWCTHSVCLGFHTMPIAEGRNDVFSAIYTRFPIAPDVVIYDYACQLATYCLVREARYFRDTLFLIDELHAHGHSDCGQACFASNAMYFNELVRKVNTSAAECGNKGMRRIRKPVSFMTYEHAVLYTKAFLDVWNRNIAIRIMSM